MSTPTRIRDTGPEADRALLREAVPSIPLGVQEEVFRQVQARLQSARARWLRWAPAVLVLLLAGTALAVVGSRWTAWHRPETLHQSPPRPAPAIQPVPVPAPPPRPTPAVRPAPRPRPATLSRRPIERPELQWPPAGALVEPAGRPTAPPAETLVITREGRRELQLRATAATLSGSVRGTPVELRLEGARLRGHIGEASVELWVRGPRTDGVVVEGTIDGREVGFVLRPTPRGQLLQGAIPGHTVRLELGPTVLGWLPGCDQDLFATAAGVYEGRCASGTRARVVIPPALARMPAPQRLILLALLLTERDLIFKYAAPRLFPAEE